MPGVCGCIHLCKAVGDSNGMGNLSRAVADMVLVGEGRTLGRASDTSSAMRGNAGAMALLLAESWLSERNSLTRVKSFGA